MSFDLTQITGNMPILTGKANFRQWSMEIEVTARLGGFWGAYAGDNNARDQSAAQLDAVAQSEMKAMGLIRKTVTPIIALEIHDEIIADSTKSLPF